MAVGTCNVREIDPCSVEGGVRGSTWHSSRSPFPPCTSCSSALSPRWAAAMCMRSLRGSHHLGQQGCHLDRRPTAGHQGG